MHPTQLMQSHAALMLPYLHDLESLLIAKFGAKGALGIESARPYFSPEWFKMATYVNKERNSLLHVNEEIEKAKPLDDPDEWLRQAKYVCSVLRTNEVSEILVTFGDDVWWYDDAELESIKRGMLANETLIHEIQSATRNFRAAGWEICSPIPSDIKVEYREKSFRRDATSEEKTKGFFFAVCTLGISLPFAPELFEGTRYTKRVVCPSKCVVRLIRSSR